MKIDKITRMNMLYDYYGQLLSEKQSRIFTLYHEDNLSLSEIGFELDLSKQGVHDALKKAEVMLEDFEEKLGLISKSMENEDTISKTKEIIAKISQDNGIGSDIKKEIKKIEKNIDKLIIID